MFLWLMSDLNRRVKTYFLNNIYNIYNINYLKKSLKYRLYI